MISSFNTGILCGNMKYGMYMKYISSIQYAYGFDAFTLYEYVNFLLF